MEQGRQIRLTSAELSELVTQYMQDSASVCTLSYFLEKAEDTEIKSLLKHALQISKSHIEKISSILTEEKNKVPYGFKVEEDVDLNASRLYSDGFVLTFVNQMASIGLTMYGTSLSLATRSDISSFYKECLSETMELYETSKNLLLSKGLYIKPPYFPNLEEVEFVEKQRFLWDALGEKRPLIGTEVTSLHANIQRNALGTAILTGFSQVAQSKNVIKLLLKGIEISKKHIRVFGEKLEESNLPIPMTWDSESTTSTTYTFSDKLMMYYTTTLSSMSIGFYGVSVSQSPRVDLGVMYNRLSAEIQKFSEDGANIMIKNQWLEKPPMAPDRKKLAE